VADGGVTYSQSLNAYLGVLETWNVSTEKLTSALNTSANSGVFTVEFSPDGKALADGGAGGNGIGVIEQWNVSSSTLANTFATANPEVKSLAFSPGGLALADGGSTNPEDGQVASGVAEVFDVSTGLLTSTLNTITNNGVSSVALSPDGKTLAYGASINQGTVAATEVCTVQLWDVPTGVLLKTLNLAATGAFLPVTAVAFSPDGQTLVVGAAKYNSSTSTASGVLQLWSVSTGKLITTFDTSSNSGLTAVAFSPDGKTLADGGLGYSGNTNFGVLELWDLSTDKLLKTLKTAASNGVSTVGFSQDRSFVIDGGSIYNSTTTVSSGVLEIWSLSTGLRVAAPSLLAGTGHVLSVALSPDGEVLFAGADSNLQAYSMSTYHLLNYFNVLDDLSNPGSVNSVVVSADGSLLAYGSASGAVVLGGNPYYNPVPVSTIGVSPQTVMGGTGSMGTVTLKQAAPAGGDSVALVSSNHAVGVPTSVRIEPGETQATFPITTQILSSNTAVVITATSGGASATATLKVSNLSVIGLSLNPTMVVGGNSSVATVTLSGSAPSGGITTSVTSGSQWAGVPSTISVNGGATQATLTVTTSVVNAQTTATITAGNGTASTSATLTITPATLQSLTLNPTTVAGGASTTGSVTLSGHAGSAGLTVSLSSNSNVGLPNIVTIGVGKNSETFTVTTQE